MNTVKADENNSAIDEPQISKQPQEICEEDLPGYCEIPL